MFIELPEWCRIGNTFRWYVPEITGTEWVTERIIGYTEDGFLHTAHNCPLYETKFDNLNTGVKLKDG